MPPPLFLTSHTYILYVCMVPVAVRQMDNKQQLGLNFLQIFSLPSFGLNVTSIKKIFEERTV